MLRRGTRTVLLSAALVGGALALPSAAPPAFAGAGENVTAYVSVTPTGDSNDGQTLDVRYAADGRFVAFSATGTKLVAGLSSSVRRVYVRDLFTDTTYLLSKSNGGIPAGVESSLGGISKDGRYVTFSTAAKLDSADTDTHRDVYLWDRKTKRVERVSITWNEQGSDGDNGMDEAAGSKASDVSDDGRYVAFTSLATNLSPATDTNARIDVYLRDRTNGSTSRISQNAALQGDGSSTSVDLSGTGRFAVFVSYSKNWGGTDTNNAGDVYLRDANAISLTKVSVGLDADANGGSSEPNVSDDGRFVSFTSTATDLVSGDTNATTDVFRRDLSALSTVRMSVTGTNTQLAGGGRQPSMTSDGSTVAFVTATKAEASDLDADEDVYTRSGTSTVLRTIQSGGAQLSAPATTPSLGNGQRVAWISAAGYALPDTNGTYDAFAVNSPFIGTHADFPNFVGAMDDRFGLGLTSAERDAQVARFRRGSSPQTWILKLADDPTFSAKRAPVIRLYWAFFKRRPDLNGLTYWINKYKAGTTLVRIANEFAKSSEFKTKYGNTTNAQFVTLVYLNVLERNPDLAGLDYWVAKMDAGTPRGQVMTSFSESSEGKRKIAPRSDTILVALGMYGKIPSKDLFDAIVTYLQTGEVREWIPAYILGAPEYQATYPV